MIAPRLVWMPPDFDVAYVSKSDYDELKAKLTATQSELAKIYATEPVAVYEGVEFSRYTLRWVNGDLAVGTNFYAAPIPPTEVEPATEYAEYILDHYDRKSRKDRKLLGKHLAEWADRRYRDAAPIPSINEINNLKGFIQALAHDFDCCANEADSSDPTLAERLRKCRDHALNEALDAPIPLTDEIVEIKRQRDSAVGSLEWIHNATKTGASIDVICGYTKGALQEVRLAAPIPPDEPKLKRASLMAFGVISEIRKLVGNGKVQFVADLGGSIWTWPDAADSAITELRSVCFDTAPIPPTPTPIQQEALMRVNLIGTPAEVIPMDRDLLRDFILARPDTEGSGK